MLVYNKIYVRKVSDKMRFVRTDELSKGMRLAKPIYNKNGVLLYDRDTKLTKQGINSIKNFKLIGIYILEPAEPLPPMSEDDVEYERFQTMSVFGLKEAMDEMLRGNKPANMYNLVKMIIKQYAKRSGKINVIQNVRSEDDYVYKHSINVATLAALMGARLRVSVEDMRDMVTAALIHDIGRLYIDPKVLEKEVYVEEDRKHMANCEARGNKELQEMPFFNENVRKMLEQKFILQTDKTISVEDSRYCECARILQVAEKYDDMTSMKLGEEPTSDVVAVRELLGNPEIYDEFSVAALMDSLKILIPGVCVELSNHNSGIVIRGNNINVLRPLILCFNDNQLYNFEEENVAAVLNIKDVMKTMDKRIKIDQATIDEYMRRYG